MPDDVAPPPTVGSAIDPATTPQLKTTSKGARWLTLALASGAFAAFNGVFAKLTTTSSTHNLARHISSSPVAEVVLRAIFFALNIASNAVMWYLFTRALTASPSTVKVQILNTSSNFIVTAVLGAMIFAESLPAGWWMGAGLLVLGSVIIGSRDNDAEKNGMAEGTVRLDETTGRIGEGNGVRVFKDDEDENETAFKDNDQEDGDDGTKQGRASGRLENIT